MALNELAGIGILLSVLLLATVLFRQFAPEYVERGLRIMLDLVATGLLLGVVLILAQLTGVLG
jgi:hypothetical protein